MDLLLIVLVCLYKTAERMFRQEVSEIYAHSVDLVVPSCRIPTTLLDLTKQFPNSEINLKALEKAYYRSQSRTLSRCQRWSFFSKSFEFDITA